MYRFQDLVRYWQKIFIFFLNTRLFDSAAEKVSPGIVWPRLGSKNWNDGATRPRRESDDIFSRFDTIHECDRQTDRQTDTGQRLLPRLRIASPGKNDWTHGHQIWCTWWTWDALGYDWFVVPKVKVAWLECLGAWPYIYSVTALCRHSLDGTTVCCWPRALIFLDFEAIYLLSDWLNTGSGCASGLLAFCDCVS